LCLDCDGSEVAYCNSVAVDRYIVSFDMTDRCRVWKMENGSALVWFFGTLRLEFAHMLFQRTLSTDGLFFAWGFLQGMRADKTLHALSSRSAWFGPSRRPGKPLNSP
jgi:hypothetical protein